MTTTSLTASRPTVTPTTLRTSWPAPLRALARRAVIRILGRIQTGELILREGSREQRFGHSDGLTATVNVHDPDFFPTVALRGGLGAGEAYIVGHWTTDDPTSVIRLFVRNQAVLEELRSGLRWLIAPLLGLSGRAGGGSRAHSRQHIGAHYDLGNEFFELFLDPTMTYSCGIFETPHATLEQASVAKLERVCRQLGLGPDDHVLEIGTGWGSFALHAARSTGCRVTTTTISRQQFDRATARVREAGLQDRVTVLDLDYRDLTGCFDHVVSIEMIEAVGADHYDSFFRVCSGRLRPGGRMVLQAITIRDELFEKARRTVDFIRRYIFPGSCLPSLGVLREAISGATDLEITGVDDITQHYPPTLRAWRDGLLRRTSEAGRLGYDEAFLRMWEFYFCYCEGGFAEGRIGDVQMTLTKPREARNS